MREDAAVAEHALVSTVLDSRVTAAVDETRRPLTVAPVAKLIAAYAIQTSSVLATSGVMVVWLYGCVVRGRYTYIRKFLESRPWSQQWLNQLPIQRCIH